MGGKFNDYFEITDQENGKWKNCRRIRIERRKDWWNKAKKSKKKENVNTELLHYKKNNEGEKPLDRSKNEKEDLINWKSMKK